jgi:hypothetical protein
MNENNIHDITTIEKQEDEASILDQEIDGLGGTFVIRPFWESTIIRAGIVIVAVTIVKTAGRVITARNNAKFNG